MYNCTYSYLSKLTIIDGLILVYAMIQNKIDKGLELVRLEHHLLFKRSGSLHKKWRSECEYMSVGVSLKLARHSQVSKIGGPDP